MCWAKFERASLGEYKIAALSWMFREAKITWDYLLLASVTLILAMSPLNVENSPEQHLVTFLVRVDGIVQKHVASLDSLVNI